MAERVSIPGLRLRAILLIALSLSIGWGIRGNFGHEYGAMIAGALSAIAACLLSGREDWRSRVAYFGMFGALGWAFGGSISYMQVIAYTHSGHLPSQVFGFIGLFIIGFLWAGMGGAGTALPAVLEQRRLTDLIKPICWVFAGWLLMGAALFLIMEQFKANMDFRHEDPLYWFDSDWVQACMAVLALLAFDLWDRRKEFGQGVVSLPIIAVVAGTIIYFAGTTSLRVLDAILALAAFFVWDAEDERPYRGVAFAACVVLVAAALYWCEIAGLRVLAVALTLVLIHYVDQDSMWVHPLVKIAGAGALAGFVLQALLVLLGLARPLARFLVVYQGDTCTFPKEQLMMNWPEFFLLIPNHLGWVLGLIVGISAYFRFYGKFRSGASLLMYMAVGWLAGFLLLPVLGSLSLSPYGGLRMTPPRGDDWAGILGLYVGTLVYLRKNGLLAVVWSSLVSAFIGGLAFSGVQIMKMAMMRPGHPKMVSNPEIVNYWAHWQSANWHSWLEQTYGFFNGVGIAIALGLLAARAPRLVDSKPQKRWTVIFAASFVVLGITYLNIVKNVKVWTERGLPETMKAPLFQSIELSSRAWFSIMFAFLALVVIALMIRHCMKPIAVVPNSWLGKGQIFYLVFLWMMVVANFERALMGFQENRILTEGVIFANAILVTAMILLWPRDRENLAEKRTTNFRPLVWGTIAAGVVATVLAICVETRVARKLYRDEFTTSKRQTRFGPEATWRTDPLLKGEQHR